MKRRIVFRVDGGGSIGLGHIMRCLNLAEGLKEKGMQCIFITKDIDPEAGKRIVDSGHLVERLPAEIDLEEDLKLTVNLIKKYQLDLVVTDSYDINEIYLKRIKDLNIPLMSLDDLANMHLFSDIVLNQNIGVKVSDYSRERYTKLLLGPKYVLLRKEVRDRHCFRREIKEVAKNILVTLGGTDPNNQTLKVVKALKGIKNNIKITVVIGPSYLYEEILRKEIETDSRFILTRNLKDILGLMEKADIAISGGGSTCYELAYLGVPNIIIVLSDNQRKNADSLDNYGTSLNLGWFEEVTEDKIKETIKDLIKAREKRKGMSRKGRELVDGRGVERVVEEILVQLKWNNISAPKVRFNSKEKKVIRVFAERIKNNIGDNITSLGLFGSKARGDFQEDSDIDILIVLKEKSLESKKRIFDIMFEVDPYYDLKISPRIMSLYEYQKNKDMGSPFIKRLEKEGIKL
ncbi:UDP-2,4-diacetamido-2,4,6-trideoxy-beta-L-altropyranose hydrolase [bacterium]|nr:UDP-2,4-diacetamido-2,4,6-trideoxy-beta-L-altropyranose hydrolase [bacterium]